MFRTKNFIKYLFFLITLLFNQTSFEFTAGKSYGSKENNESITVFEKNVILKGENVTLFADIAKQFSNQIQLIGNIKMIHKLDTLYCNKITIYNQEDNDKYIAQGNVLFLQPEIKIQCDNMNYWPNSNNILGALSNNVRMNENNNVLNCDQLTIFNKEIGKYKAIGNISFTQNNKMVQCQKLIYSPNENYLHAFIDGMIADSLITIKGDSIYCDYKDSQFEKIDISSNTKITHIRYAKEDSLSTPFPVDDIIRGNSISLFFNNQEEPDQVYVSGMAEADFNVIKNDILKGKNYISGDSIKIQFHNNLIQILDVAGGAQGIFYPTENYESLDTNIYYYAENISYNLDDELSYLVNDAKVISGRTQLEAGKIKADWNLNTLEADTHNNIQPQVITPTSQYPMYGSSMKFNLSTNQGKILDGYTDLDLGIFTGKGNQEIFQEENKNVHIKNSVFTSCNLEKPHYYFYSDYMKLIPNDKIIAKPMTMYINEFKILHIPFAILPNSNNTRQSGWIMPSFGNRSSSGTYIDDLGYYWAPNNYMDIKTLIDFQDKRGLYTQTTFRYNKKSGKKWHNYRLNGSLKYQKKIYLLDHIKDFKYLFDEDSTTSVQNIHFKHNQFFDPTQSVSINYNFKSEKDVDEVDLLKRLDQNLSSSLNYTKRWKRSVLSMGYNQNEELFIIPPDSVGDDQFYKYTNGPNISYGVNSIKLFGGGDKWYNKIYMSYNFNYNHGKKSYYKTAYALNDTTYSWKNLDSTEYRAGGASNKFKLNMNTKIKWLSLIPSINLAEDWIWQFSEQSSNDPSILDLNNGYKRRLMWNINLNANTNIYGVIPIELGAINSIRHKISPGVTFSYQPNFRNNDENYIDPFSSSSLGITSFGYKRATFKINNLFQAKILNEHGEYDKRDFLSWDMNLTYSPDNQPVENNLSELFSYLSLKKPNGGEYLSIQMRHNLYNDQGDLLDFKNGELPNLVYFNAKASTKINIFGTYFQQESNVIDSLDIAENAESDSLLFISSYVPKLNKNKKWQTDFYANISGGYTEYTDKWDLNHFNVESRTTFYLTKNWLLTHAHLFNLIDMKIQPQSLKFYRPLHCWDFFFTWWASGYSKGFRLTININSPDLQDIKISSSSSNRQFGY